MSLVFKPGMDLTAVKSTSRRVALVNTVNTLGVAGKGLALAFRRRFPANFKAYQVACFNGQCAIGKPFVFQDEGFHIVNFPTKADWRQPSHTAYIKQGLAALKTILQIERIEAIAMPPLGCGLGGLHWPDVRELLIGFTQQPELANIRFCITGKPTGPRP